MKLNRIAAMSAAMLLVPAMFSACTSTGKEGAGDTGSVTEQPAEPVEVKTPAEKPAGNAVQPQPATPQDAEPAPVLVPEQAPKQATEPTSKQTPKQAPKQTPKQASKEPAPAPAPKAEKKTTLPCDHVVKTGDNLWSLARKYYGEGAKWKLIFDANKATLKNENFLEPGKVLKIPAAK